MSNHIISHVLERKRCIEEKLLRLESALAVNLIGNFLDSTEMGAPGSDDTVSIEIGKKAGEPHVITVNCPDRTGLGCDICRIILDFGLYITKGGKILNSFKMIQFILCNLLKS